MEKHVDFHVSKRSFIDFIFFTPFAFGRAMNQLQATISFRPLFRWPKGQLWIWKQVDHRHRNRNYRDRALISQPALWRPCHENRGGADRFQGYWTVSNGRQRATQGNGLNHSNASRGKSNRNKMEESSMAFNLKCLYQKSARTPSCSVPQIMYI